MLFALVNQ